MMEFYYKISFKKFEDMFIININLEYENYTVPIFYRTFSANKEDIIHIYDQINEYFELTNIKMTKNDIKLFYNTFRHSDLTLPIPHKVIILDEDYHLSVGLTPKEMFFLMYINNKSTSAKKAKYWVEEYHLDVEYTINNLIRSGYLTCDDYLFNLNKATKKDLCDFLEAHKLTCSGNKPEIISYIKESVSEQELRKVFSGLYYKQTVKGAQIALSSENLNDFHKSYYRYAKKLKIEEFYILSKRYKDIEAKDVCKMLVDNKTDVITTDFDWEKFINEISGKNDNKAFVDIIKKYDTVTSSKQEAINVIEEKEVIKEEDQFINIINKYSAEEKLEKEVVSEADFYKVVFKNRLEKEEEKREKALEITEHLDITTDDNLDEEEPVIIKGKNPALVFIQCFIGSSILSIAILYIIYQYIFD